MKLVLVGALLVAGCSSSFEGEGGPACAAADVQPDAAMGEPGQHWVIQLDPMLTEEEASEVTAGARAWEAVLPCDDSSITVIRGETAVRGAPLPLPFVVEVRMAAAIDPYNAEDMVGWCDWGDNSARILLKWPHGDPSFEVTIMHELGHAFGLEHNDASAVMTVAESPPDACLSEEDVRNYARKWCPNTYVKKRVALF